MKALLLVAHGSKRPATRDEIEALTLHVKAELGDAYDAVAFAFLQWAAPSIPDQLGALIANGATRIVVLPYLLATGSHVAADIPEALGACRDQHPEVTITLLPHIGLAAGMTGVIAEHATAGHTAG